MNKPTPTRTYNSLVSLDKVLGEKDVKLNSKITIFGSAAIGIYHANYLMNRAKESPYSLNDIKNYLFKNENHKKINEDVLRESKDLDLIVDNEDDLKNIAKTFGSEINSVYLSDELIYQTTFAINGNIIEVFYMFKLDNELKGVGKINNLEISLINYNELFMQKLILKDKFEKKECDAEKAENTNYDLEILKKIN